MFEDSFLDDNQKLRSHRSATTVFSFVVQGVIVLFLVMLPLLYTEAIPTPQLMTILIAPPPPPPPPPPPASAAKVQTARAPVVKASELLQPVKIPEKVAMVKDEPQARQEGPPAAVAGVVGGVPGGVPGGQIGGVLGGVLGAAPALPKVAAPQRVRVSQGVSEGLLIHKVMPEYPLIARQARVQGLVVLHAQIAKDGTIQQLTPISGPPMLQKAAMDAVRQWRYKPYYLNGQPVEIDTVINVNFKLAG